MNCHENDVNENRINHLKRAKSSLHQLKKLLKPLLHLLKKNRTTSYKSNPQPDYLQEIEDNASNEALERRIFEEIDSCPDFSAVPVYEDGVMDIIPVFRGERYIPVHFAKTEAGTFFWTTMMGADQDVCCEGDWNAITEKQRPQVQTPFDRWAQA